MQTQRQPVFGRCHKLAPDLALAFAMRADDRLCKEKGAMGKEQRLEEGVCKEQGGAFALHADVVKRVVDACRRWPEGPAGEVEGVVRLLGGGLLWTDEG